MKVVSVDPGYDRLGVAVMELVGDQEQVLYSTCIETDKSLDLPERLYAAGKEFLSIINKYSPDALAIETLFFNKNQKTAMGVAQMRGILIYLAKETDCKIYEFSPQEIKIAATGHGRSSKTAVIDMVKRLVPTAPPKALDDEYDAIAVGITYLAHYGRKQ